MNLKLNFEKQVRRNPNLELFSKNTVELYTDGTATLHYLGDHYNNRVDLLPISSLFDNVDAEIFAYETGMRDVTDFKVFMENMYTDYKHLFNEDEKYVLGVTNKYNYKPGTYDTIKTIINKMQRFQQRPTQQANQMSDYFDMLHFIPTDIEDHVANNNYTYIKLYTIVKCFSKDMTIINNRNEEMCKMTVPDTYLMFVRPLWKALTTDNKSFEDYQGSCPGGYHPYLNSVPYYSYDPPSTLIIVQQ